MRQAAQEIYGAPAGSGVGWLASGAMSAAGRAWSYVTDEAAVLSAANSVAAVKPRMAVGLTVSLKGAESFSLAHVMHGEASVMYLLLHV